MSIRRAATLSLAGSPSQSSLRDASSPKVGALGSPRKLHLFAKASPFGRGGFAKQRRRGRGRCGGTNSLSQSLSALTAPSGREPLAKPETLQFNRQLCRHAKGPIPEGAGIERSEMTGGVSSPPTPKQPDCPGGAVWLRGLILPASCWRGPLLRRADRRRPAGASCRRGWGSRWAG